MGRFLGAADLRRRNFVLPRRFLCAAALAALSAGSDGGPPKNTEGLTNLQPGSGTVSFEGKPTPGAVVLFHPAADPDSHKKRIAGIGDEEGCFEMITTVGA